MATSAMSLEGKVLFVRDAALREFIKAVVFHLPERIISNPEVSWLTQACFTWIDDHENMPPGLKDIEFDGWLLGLQRKKAFREYLQWLKFLPPPSAEYDLDVVVGVIDELERKLFS
ncbi:hypothetical protein [Pseudomonas tohonis]|uniref:hypothetical protein n=1 Tax=Pseudomonas tohonis TaxID=2725477 RepID=UPI001F164394|nr:hypothetical protein [Pseudomonas tohonis]